MAQGYVDKKNCLLGALHWQVTGGLLIPVSRSVRETSVSSQTVGCSRKGGNSV